MASYLGERDEGYAALNVQDGRLADNRSVVSVVLADKTLMTLENQPTTGQRFFRTTLRSWYALFLFTVLVAEILLLTPPFDTSIDLAGSGQGRLLFTIQHALRPTIITAAIALFFKLASARE